MLPTRNSADYGETGLRNLQHNLYQARRRWSLLRASTVLAGSPAALLAALIAVSSSAQAQTSWTGSVSTDWFMAGNWSAGLPGPAQDVELNTVTTNPTVINVPGAAAQNLTIGVDSVGQLAIMGGGTVTNGGFALIGQVAGSQGMVTVTGPGSTWTSNDYLSVGEGGTGHLTIANGGAVTAFEGSVGYAAGSQGTVIVTGPGSTWTNSNELWVGQSGTGHLTIANGGAVTAYQGYVGFDPGAQGTVTVTGPGSTWINSDALTVGGSGHGQLTVADGGTVSSSDGLLGAFADSRGMATVTGPGSTWTNSTALLVGLYGNGQLTVANGGAVSSFVGFLGYDTTAQGTAIVTGPGSRWTNNDFLVVGLAGTGQLTIADGGQVNAGGPVGIAMLPGSTGALNIGAPSGQPAAAPGTLNAAFVFFGDGNGTLTFNHTGTAYTFAADISGHGAVNVLSGTTILTATNLYTGPTVVSGGSLVVNGAIASSVTLNGGTLGGSGIVGGIQAQGGGIVAPGNSIGTLNVAGDVAFSAGSTYQVEVNAAGQGDRIAATGNAKLTGGTVQVLAQSGSYQLLTGYTILTASDGVAGQFDNVTSNLAFLSPTLSYQPTSVTLQLTRNNLDFAAIASTRNQFATGGGVESLGYGNRIYDAILFATADEARAGFDLLSGEAHAQGVAVAIGESRLVREAILGRLRRPLLVTQGSSVAAEFSSDLPTPKGATMLPAPRFEERFAVWGEAVGAQASSNGDGNAAGLSQRSGGAILGADLKLYDSGASSLTVGVASGYTRSNFDVDARRSSGRIESGHAALYADARSGAWRLAGGLAYSFGETSLTRQVQLRGFSDRLRSDRDSQLLQAFGEFGYAFRFERFAIEPFAQLALLRISSGSAVEQGGPAALRVSSGEQNFGFATLGLRSEAQLGTMPLFARGLLGWRHGFGELTPQALTAFAIGATPARVHATAIDRNALVAEAGLDWRASQSTTLGLAYSAAIGERTRDHALKGRIDVRF